jgi:hypothetical protein
MDIGSTLQVLRDPAGIPSHPLVFQVLMVFTWIFHILFVNIALGSAAMALIGFRRRIDPHWQRLSMAMTKVAKVSVSLLVVLGVAPLLFTQVIYDPQWYTSNVLSASWAIAFIFTLIVGYSSWFVFYFRNKEGAGSGVFWFGALGLAMFLLDGFIMHALSYQALLPDQWMQWYAPNGEVDMSGSAIHAWQTARGLFFLAMSAVVFGAFLLAYGDYFSVREDRPADYLAFARRLGGRIGGIGAGIAFVLLVFWLAGVPGELGMWTHPITLLLGLYLLVLAFGLWHQRDGAPGRGYLMMLLASGMAALVAIFREALRVAYMQPFGYDVLDYKVMADYPSTALFFLTLLGVGGLVGGFYLATLYRAGRTEGVYQASPAVASMGTGAVGILVIWVAVFFLTGLWVWLGNV